MSTAEFIEVISMIYIFVTAPIIPIKYLLQNKNSALYKAQIRLYMCKYN